MIAYRRAHDKGLEAFKVYLKECGGPPANAVRKRRVLSGSVVKRKGAKR